MNARRFYRIAAVLLVLFAVTHTLGFSQSDSGLSVRLVLASMKSVQFDVLGSRRTYWELFLAAGYTVGALYAFAAVLAWQLGSMSDETRSRLRLTAWAFALAFAVITALSLRYLFVAPVVFSGLITACLAAAAGLSGQRA